MTFFALDMVCIPSFCVHTMEITLKVVSRLKRAKEMENGREISSHTLSIASRNEE